MIIGAKIVIKGHLAMPKAKLVEYEKDAFTVALQEWHRKMLPGHFKRNAQRVYHYEAPSPSYSRRLFDRFGSGLRRLMWSGASRRLAERKIVIRRTKTHTDGKISLAKAFNFSGRYSMPDMKGEVKRILKREKKVLLKLVGERVRSRLNNEASVKVINL